MAICKKCGRNEPVLTRTSNPSFQRYIGTCKRCIKSDLDSMKDEMLRKVKGVLSEIFS